MEEIVKKLFNGLIQGFGKNHSKIYCSLLSEEPKTAHMLSLELEISQELCYRILNCLEKHELIGKSNSTPASYTAFNPKIAFHNLVEKKVHGIEKKEKTLLEILPKINKPEKIEIIITTNGTANLIKEKRIVKKQSEILEIKKAIDTLYVNSKN